MKSLFTVDEKKCKHDGICAHVCPRGLIEMEGADTIPVPSSLAVELCSKCGHCVAVCPHGALSHTAMTPEECPPVNREWTLTPEKVEYLLRSRRSIRNYQDKPVDRELLAKLIDIARFAPTGGNTQPVEWLVIYDAQEVKRIAEIIFDWMVHVSDDPSQAHVAKKLQHTITAWQQGHDRICREAPHLILTHASESLQGALISCTIALTYLELAAPSFGLGACWAGFTPGAAEWPPLRELLNLPEGNKCFGAMMIGYPHYAYHRLPLRNEPRILWH